MTSAHKPIRILVADDSSAFLRNISLMIGIFDNLKSVGSARNGNEAVSLCEIMKPDVVLMDLEMPMMDGITATGIIKQRWPQIEVIGLTGFDEPNRIREMLEAGASNCLAKTTPIAEILDRIVQVVSHS